MRYLGGKTRLSVHLAPVLKRLYQEDHRDTYIEPFVGSAAICSSLSSLPNRFASDTNLDLILLWQAVCDGWVPPDCISEEEYNALKNAPPSALRGFAGFGLSFSGKFFGGYARDNRGDDYAGQCKRSLLKRKSLLQEVRFLHLDYTEWNPSNALIYCDPPYIGTTEYKGASDFDHDRFWNCVREWSKNNTVVVSEYQAPDDFTAIWTKDVSLGLRSSSQGERRVEKLFMLGPHAQQGQLILL